MSLSSAALIAKSGLAAVATETSVVSRNISGNSDTTLYSRKIANVSTGANGAQLVSVTRAASQAVFENLLSSTAASAKQDSITAGLDALNQTIGNLASDSGATASSASSPSALLSSFTNALQSFEASPSGASFAANAVTAANNLAAGLNRAATTVQQARSQADSKMEESVKTINSLLTQFQTVNAQVANGTATGADVTDAQDARDNILARLANEIGITTTTGSNNDMSIYTDGGVTLFQGGAVRSVTFVPTDTFTSATLGNAVYIDGAPVTGGSAMMPITSGALAGNADLRDKVAVTYQEQLDNIAGSLISQFSESEPAGAGPELAGLFSTPGTSALPATFTGLAGLIAVNPQCDPGQGGSALLLRDGINYSYNTGNQAGFTDRLSKLIGNLSATLSFSAGGEIATSATLSAYASASVGWLESARSNASSASTYQSTLLGAAKTALSNATGVNLDAEMSKMLDLEQSYSASAKLITTIDGMFSAFMTDIGRIPA